MNHQDNENFIDLGEILRILLSYKNIIFLGFIICISLYVLGLTPIKLLIFEQYRCRDTSHALAVEWFPTDLAHNFSFQIFALLYPRQHLTSLNLKLQILKVPRKKLGNL